MADLINRAALFADIDETIVYSGRIGTNAEMRGANKIVDRIKAAPAVDAVEAVRCEACKSFGMYSHGRYGFCSHPHGLMSPKPDQFCSYGERRTDV